MSKFHINPDTGVINRCHATSLDNCPYGGAAGDVNHFESIKEGRDHYERVMNEKLINSMRKDPNFTEIKTDTQLRERFDQPNNNLEIPENQMSLLDEKLNVNIPINSKSQELKSKQPEQSAIPKTIQKNTISEADLNGDFSQVGQRDLNRMVKDTKNESLMLEAANRGSERVLSSLVNNSHATADSLIKAAERTNDKVIRRQAMQHKNYPVSKLSVEEFHRTLTNDNKNYRYASDDITDEHIKQALNFENNGTQNVYSPNYNGSLRMISNPNNKVSPEVVQQVIASKSANPYYLAQYGIPSGKLDLKTTMDNIPPNSQNSRTEYITKFAENKRYENDAVNYLINTYNNSYNNASKNNAEKKELFRAASSIATMNIDGKNIDKIAVVFLQSATDSEKESPDYQEFQKNIVKNNNTPKYTRDYIIEGNPKLASAAKAADFKREYPKEAEELTTVISNRRLGNAYNESLVQVDKEKATQFGLDDEAIIELYSANYNAGFSYDAETGIIRGRVDSSG